MGSYSENAGLREAAPFLCRLAHDASGNTLALLAAGLFPLLALVGGGVDMGRNYLAQSRLQQACDAGVLSSCPAPASPLAQMTAAQVDEYLSSLTPEGSTYHDIGMIWGARMLSPTGIFADENADHAGKPTNRNLIFLTDGETAPLDLAYGDVSAAFDQFIASIPPGSPFVIAGHSQGGYHLKRLLADKIKGTPLAPRLVAAYPIGWLVDQVADLPAMGFPACTAPDQTGCVISWLSYTDDGQPAMMIDAYQRFAGQRPAGSPAPRYLCSNPLTGMVGGTAPASANLGAMVPDAQLKEGTIKPALVGARCDDQGILRIGSGPDMGPYVLPDGNYHVYDVPLFWSNLRADFIRRAKAWQPR